MTIDTTNKYRSVTIPAGNTVTGNFCPDGTNFGADSEGTKTSAGIIYAGLNGTSTSIASIPVTVTRTFANKTTYPSPTSSGTPTRSSSSFTITIGNFDNSCSYYYSTTVDGEKTELTPTTGKITITVNKNTTRYLWAGKSGLYSNPTTVTRGDGNSITVTPGENKTLYSYTYSFTGPSEATTIEFSQNVDDVDAIKLYYGSNTLATYVLGDLD